MDMHINDKIVHASFGVGKIIKRTSKTIGGKKHLYYAVKTEKLTYWLPIKNSDSKKIRPIRSAATFEKMLSTIRKKPQKISDNFRKRNKFINDEINKCSLHANTKLIRDLQYRDSISPLHVNEHRILEKLKIQFINEFAISVDIEKEEAARRLEDALAISARKIKKSS
jgi:RNA polymerase-interacting CarD/CdnL/TRCF family regulator